MEREGLNPDIPLNLAKIDKDNFIRHFADRDAVESRAFGNLAIEPTFGEIQTLRCNSDTLNSQDSVNFVKDFSPDLCFVFGPDLIKNPLLRVLPDESINLHLGLSPWYRGSATLFWPFYFLQPQYAGATFHKVIKEADAGSILHQCIPNLKAGDGVHDVAANTVIKAKEEVVLLLKHYLYEKKWIYKDQTFTGKLFLTCDFEPIHLRILYNLYDNNIVDAYLKGELGLRTPKLVNFFDNFKISQSN